jgi:hypothetical protein
MTLLSDVKAKLPVGARIDLEADHVHGQSHGTFEVVDVNSAEGDEDNKVFVTYRSVGSDGKGEQLIYEKGCEYSITTPRTKIVKVQKG